MATTAHVAGGTLLWNPETERFEGNDAEAVQKANAWAHREYQNGWSLTSPYYKDWA